MTSWFNAGEDKGNSLERNHEIQDIGVEDSYGNIKQISDEY
jgi:hypothetical protein